jgi:hypothetical protein
VDGDDSFSFAFGRERERERSSDCRGGGVTADEQQRRRKQHHVECGSPARRGGRVVETAEVKRGSREDEAGVGRY